MVAEAGEDEMDSDTRWVAGDVPVAEATPIITVGLTCHTGRGWPSRAVVTGATLDRNSAPVEGHTDFHIGGRVVRMGMGFTTIDSVVGMPRSGGMATAVRDVRGAEVTLHAGARSMDDPILLAFPEGLHTDSLGISVVRTSIVIAMIGEAQGTGSEEAFAASVG